LEAVTGSFGNVTVGGKLTFGGNDSYYINANYNDSSYYIYLPGIKVDSANGAILDKGKIGEWYIDGKGIYASSSSTHSDIRITPDTLYAKASGDEGVDCSASWYNIALVGTRASALNALALTSGITAVVPYVPGTGGTKYMAISNGLIISMDAPAPKN
jgi:hypothetical protein